MGGSSGGSSSGAVSYPDYMETIHSTWLTAVAGDITTAQTGDNPYTAATAYDPDCVLAATNYIISLFYDEAIAMDPATDWSTYYDAAAAKYTAATITAITDYTFTPTITDYTFTPTITAFSFDSDILSDTALAALVTAYQSDLESRRDASYKPSYKVGMLNVNSVMNSAFILGDTITTVEIEREVARFSADLYFQNEQKKIEYQKIQADENTAHNSNVISYENVQSGENTGHNSNVINYENVQAGENTTHNANIVKRDAVVVSNDTANRDFNGRTADSIMAKDIAHLGLYQALSQITTEANRIKLVAKGEENQRNIKFDALDATWDLEIYQYGGNVLASISGAASATNEAEISTAQSVLGGAMSGAAIGAQSANPYGVAIGAVVGGIGGLIAS